MARGLKKLNELEAALIARLNNFTGSIEEKGAHLEKSDISSLYWEVYDSYIELLPSEIDGTEALKRALFLCWYEQTEPAIYTGLIGLADRESTIEVFDAVDAQVGSRELDPELRWMVRYYYEVGEWVFEPHLYREHLRVFLLSTGGPESRFSEDLSSDNFVDRGQMGYYWSSVITSAKERAKFRRGLDSAS